MVIQPKLTQRVIRTGSTWNQTGDGTYLDPDGRVFLILDLGFLNSTFHLVDLAQSTEGRSG
jgi:hypothetical protein